METEGQEFTSEEQVSAPETESNSPGNEQVEANPFWGEVESKLGPNNFQVIKPYLDKADTAARQRVEAVNQSYAPWKAFADQNIRPEHVQQALGVVQQLNTEPEKVFESLRGFLEREGRMPNQAELKQEVIDDEEEADPRDQQLQTLAEQQQMIAEFLQNQQLAAASQAAAQEADTWLSTEVSRLSDPKFGYDEADVKEIVRIAAFQAQQTGQDPDNLDAAAAQFNALRDRIRTTPRPGQLAPRLPSGPGGGTPSGGAIDTSKMSKSERLELSQAILARGR